MAIDFPIVPDETALLVIDMQNGFAHPQGTLGQAGLDISQTRAIIPRIAELVELCRAAGLRIWWSQQEHYPDDRARQARRIPSHLDRGGRRLVLCSKGSWDAELVDELRPLLRPEDNVVKKHRASCFYSTTFEAELRIHGIRMLIVTGTTASFCVESTIRDAYMRDLDVVVPADCISDTDQDAYRAVLKNVDRFFGRSTTLDELRRVLQSLAAQRAVAASS